MSTTPHAPSTDTKALIKLLNELIALDYDAAAAYQEAIDRLQRDERRHDKLAVYLSDHNRHVDILSSHVRSLGGTPKDGPDAKRILTVGKVVAGGLGGDDGVMKAMESNEITTNKVYEKALRSDALTPDVRRTLTQHLEDERTHLAWIRAELNRT